MSNKYFQDIKIDVLDDKKNYSKISAEPFDRGYAVTVGNGLRRTLLTSLPGAAITSVKLDGVSHEFSTIDGVSEDMSEIILNLKKVRFKMTEDAVSELINFEFEGPGDLSASELNNYLSDFEVINGKSHIVTINKKNPMFQESMRRIQGDNPSDWLILDKSKLKGVFSQKPERSQIIEPINEQLVVELYSK